MGKIARYFFIFLFNKYILKKIYELINRNYFFHKKIPLPIPKRIADIIQAYSCFEKKTSKAKTIIIDPLVYYSLSLMTPLRIFKILLCNFLLDVARIFPPFSAGSFFQFVTIAPEFLIIGIKGKIS